jgi:prepilin-type N-terminal cleavage/methylation domain-containing protein
MHAYINNQRRGFTMLEMIVAMVASAVLLAGLGSVMFIARQVAYAPTAANRRSKTADIVNQISDELRYATVILQQTPQILEFVVADRNSDGTSEKIRYEWSGAAGDPLRKTINGGTVVDVLPSVNSFVVTLQQKSKTTTFTTTTDSAETILQSNTAVGSLKDRDISNLSYESQIIAPAYFPSVPSTAICWNATKIDFYGKQEGTVSGQVLTVQIKPTGDPLDTPTSNALGQVAISKTSLTTNDSWNTATFSSPVSGLSFYRDYAIGWIGSAVKSARLRLNDNAMGGVYESEDSGASWQFMSSRQMFYTLYGTYTTPGPSYNLTRNYVSYVRLALQSGNQSHSRVDASIPLRNSPELLATYWRTDFDRSPASSDANGDATTDWAVTGGGTFDTTKLSSGIWTATGAIETRPLSDFTTTTTVEVCCRNTSVGGNGAVTAIYLDRQSGVYAPLLVYVQKQSDGSQTLTLYGKTNDTTVKQLCKRSKLSSGLIRFRLTVLPANDVVNLQINDEDQGTFAYPRYAPTGTTDRYLTVYTDTSASEFDYVDLRAGIN